MTKVCKQCGYWIDFVPGLGWVDEEDDDQCYDEDTNWIGDGYHHPEDK